jgi:hypothetical protein
MNLNSVFQRLGAAPSDPFERCLMFYQLAIEVERAKEPDIKKYYPYPINYKSDSLALIDIPCNQDFYKQLIANSSEKFPKDFYIGLRVKRGDEMYHLLGFSVDYNDMKNFNPENELFPVPLALMEVNSKIAVEMELTEQQIANINHGLEKDVTIDSIQKILLSEIGENISIEQTIYLALSSKAIDLAQLYSELKSERWNSVASQSAILRQLLLNQYIQPLKYLLLDEDTLIRVTPLDDAQLAAVKMALVQPVAVITGPPGTGKTQVIQNILANALLLGKTALVASKNNKAVDNVKERFDLLDTHGYLLRFGSKEQMVNQSIPSLSNLEKLSRQYVENHSESSELIKVYNQTTKIMYQAKVNLSELEKLRRKRDELSTNIAEQEQAIQCEDEHRDTAIERVDCDYEDIAQAQNLNSVEVNNYQETITRLQTEIVCKGSGIWGFWYRHFGMTKYAAEVVSFYMSLPMLLRGTLPFTNLQTDISRLKSYGSITSYCSDLVGALKRVVRYLNERNSWQLIRDRSVADIQKKISRINKEKESVEAHINPLEAKEEADKESLKTSKEWIKELSVPLLNATIEYYLGKEMQGSACINAYAQIVEGAITRTNPLQNSNYQNFINQTRGLLKTLRLLAVTNLSAKNSLPMSDGLVDILIIDEASQCDVASALPLIARAKQIVVIGDPMQLRHISAITPKEEEEIKQYLSLSGAHYISYAKNSLWDYCYSYLVENNLTTAAYRMLTHHYRCHPDIIGYSNEMFYKQRMSLSLSVDTDKTSLKGDARGIVVVPVSGSQDNPDINVNDAEAKKCADLAISLVGANNDISIGITTPFRQQAEKIYDLLPEKYRQCIEVNTVHKYQGDEKDVMIYSPMVTRNSPKSKLKWIDEGNPNLVNVAVTRAKSTLYVVCDVDYIKANSSESMPLGNLVRRVTE